MLHVGPCKPSVRQGEVLECSTPDKIIEEKSRGAVKVCIRSLMGMAYDVEIPEDSTWKSISFGLSYLLFQVLQEGRLLATTARAVDIEER